MKDFEARLPVANSAFVCYPYIAAIVCVHVIVQVLSEAKKLAGGGEPTARHREFEFPKESAKGRRWSNRQTTAMTAVCHLMNSGGRNRYVLRDVQAS